MDAAATAAAAAAGLRPRQSTGPLPLHHHHHNHHQQQQQPLQFDPHQLCPEFSGLGIDLGLDQPPPAASPGAGRPADPGNAAGLQQGFLDDPQSLFGTLLPAAGPTLREAVKFSRSAAMRRRALSLGSSLLADAVYLGNGWPAPTAGVGGLVAPPLPAAVGGDWFEGAGTPGTGRPPAHASPGATSALTPGAVPVPLGAPYDACDGSDPQVWLALQASKRRIGAGKSSALAQKRPRANTVTGAGFDEHDAINYHRPPGHLSAADVACAEPLEAQIGFRAPDRRPLCRSATTEFLFHSAADRQPNVSSQNYLDPFGNLEPLRNAVPNVLDSPSRQLRMVSGYAASPGALSSIASSAYSSPTFSTAGRSTAATTPGSVFHSSPEMTAALACSLPYNRAAAATANRKRANVLESRVSAEAAGTVGLFAPLPQAGAFNFSDEDAVSGTPAAASAAGAAAAGQRPSHLPIPPKTPLEASKRHRMLDEALDAVDFEDITVAELKEMLRLRGLVTTGKKAVLIDRLRSVRERIRRVKSLDFAADAAAAGEPQGRPPVYFKPPAAMAPLGSDPLVSGRIAAPTPATVRAVAAAALAPEAAFDPVAVTCGAAAAPAPGPQQHHFAALRPRPHAQQQQQQQRGARPRANSIAGGFAPCAARPPTFCQPDAAGGFLYRNPLAAAQPEADGTTAAAAPALDHDWAAAGVLLAGRHARSYPEHLEAGARQGSSPVQHYLHAQPQQPAPRYHEAPHPRDHLLQADLLGNLNARPLQMHGFQPFLTPPTFCFSPLDAEPPTPAVLGIDDALYQ